MQFAENPDSSYEEAAPSLPTKEEILEKIRKKHKQEDERQEKIDALINGNPLAPPPLFAALRHLQDTGGPDSEKPADLIGKFPSLSARLLELANGPLSFNMASFEDIEALLEKCPVGSVAHLILGLEVVDLVEPPQALDVTKSSFWTHGIISGLAAKSIAQFLGEDEIQKYFITGLLLNIGRLVIASNLPDAARKAAARSKNSGESLFESEESILDYNHAQIGGNLLVQWGLERDLTTGVIHHFRPDKIKNGPTTVSIFHLSEAIAHDLKMGSSGETKFPRPNPNAVQSLGLTRSLLDNIKGEALSIVDEVKQILLV